MTWKANYGLNGFKQTRRQEMEDELERFKAWRIKHCDLEEEKAHQVWANELRLNKALMRMSKMLIEYRTKEKKE